MLVLDNLEYAQHLSLKCKTLHRAQKSLWRTTSFRSSDIPEGYNCSVLLLSADAFSNSLRIVYGSFLLC